MILHTVKIERLPCDMDRLRRLFDGQTELGGVGRNETPKRRDTARMQAVLSENLRAELAEERQLRAQHGFVLPRPRIDH
jgi:hypothetical protein